MNLDKMRENEIMNNVDKQQALESIVLKRKANLVYLKKIHSGESFWLNLYAVKYDELQALSTSFSNIRLEQYFNLTMSLERILESPPQQIKSVSRCMHQLMEEFEYYSSSATMQGMKTLMAKNVTCPYPSLVTTDNVDDDIRGSIYKFQNNVVFEYLKTIHIPFELDYVEVVIALFDSLQKLYDKFLMEDITSNPLIYDQLLKIDDKIYRYILSTITAELTKYMKEKIKNEIENIRDLTAILHNPSITTTTTINGERVS